MNYDKVHSEKLFKKLTVSQLLKKSPNSVKDPNFH
jgi:hypothetical protein